MHPAVPVLIIDDSSDSEQLQEVEDNEESDGAKLHQQKSTFLIPSYSILLHLIPLILRVRRE